MSESDRYRRACPKTEDFWKKEALGLEVGDTVIWDDDPYEVIFLDGRVDWVTKGLVGWVLNVHDGTAPKRLDTIDRSTLPWAFVEFENGVLTSIDYSANWKRGSRPSAEIFAFHRLRCQLRAEALRV